MLPFASLRLRSQPTWYYCEAEWHWAPAPLPDFDLWFVAAGHGEMTLNGREFVLSSGVCFLLPPGSRPLAHHDRHNPLEVFSCHFEPLGAAGELLYELSLPLFLEVRGQGAFIAWAHRAEHLWRRGDAEGRELARLLIEALVLQVWDEARQPSPSPQDMALANLAASIRRDSARKWRLDDMAREVHLSRAQFVRRFRACFGVSPAQFVIEARVERARHLLRETALSPAQIARTLGYANQHFFARQFKDTTGKTPKQWRSGAFTSQRASLS